ncbi:polyamine aminopropyltransferase [Brevibacterium litoralis]|uniref:polyamine aminopropyltransferase n=1 Tax=Brevibacterium litoralis TaxID=3138935 RepID=UPI0032ECCC2B
MATPTLAPEVLPLQPGPARFLVFFAVFLCAACGMVYELALVALGSYLLGNTIVQASIVLSVMVFAMGVGSVSTKRLVRHAAVSFAVIEAVLGLLGGLSVLTLYLAFAYMNVYTVATVFVAFVIGALIGAEIPLLMELVQRIRAQKASSAAADIFAADYVGGLVGGLAFPFLLLPVLGLPRGTLAVGAINALVGVLVVLWIFRRTVSAKARTLLAAGLVGVLVVLGIAWAYTDRIEVTGRQKLYRDPIVVAERSDYQEIVLTRDARQDDTRLYLNGDLQFGSLDEYRYHESLVHPAMDGPRERVLVLGGGDGMAIREILEYPDVEEVTVVDLDSAVVDLAMRDPRVLELNEDSFRDPRVDYLAADAFTWLKEDVDHAYDVVVADLPDPDSEATAKLYTIEFYGLIGRVMARDARLVVQAGSPYFAVESYWGIGESIAQAGFSTVPYHVDVPSFGDWGYFLGTFEGPAPVLRVPADAPEDMQFLTDPVLAASRVFPPDRDRDSIPGGPEPSSLLHPRVIEQQTGAWVGY